MKDYDYWSLWTSILFFPLGCYLYSLPGYPKPVSILIIILGVVSTIHHTRSYEDDYNDTIRWLDYIVALLLGGCLFYYYYDKVLFWVLGIIGFVIKTNIYSLCKTEEKSLIDALLHLYIICSLLYSTHI